jgi:hypothetical protein
VGCTVGSAHACQRTLAFFFNHTRERGGGKKEGREVDPAIQSPPCHDLTDPPTHDPNNTNNTTTTTNNNNNDNNNDNDNTHPSPPPLPTPTPGKLGHGNELGHPAPCRVEALVGYKVQMMACGSRHTVALLSTGEVFAWGDRENGVCGVGEVNDHQYLPRLVASLKGVCVCVCV